MIIFLLGILSLTYAFENIDSTKFKEIMEKEKGILVLDVRTPVEYREDGHIPGSILIPVQILPQHIKDIENFKNKKVLIYCRSGNRSVYASRILEQNGFNKVYNLKEGIIGWKKSGFPVEFR
ncbi:MAG: rhodanese-like domain-containing protein [Hydrogenothermaceae bacterium]|nr:rhodanese-like domain-containing protein [Hydrogenothermaceae bacterium]